MPVFTPDYLHKVAYHIYRAKGASEQEAEIVATHQVKANLVGHDSHGVIHIPEYVDRINRGHIVPGAPFVVDRETPCTAVINGNWGFGFVVTERAMNMAIDKARTNGVAAITIYHQSHIGRVGDYPTMAANQGMIGLVTADSGAGPKAVVPFGGRARRLGTNPICIGMPSDLEGTVLLDMATSAVAAGKISLARSRQEQVPLGWIVDKEGTPPPTLTTIAPGEQSCRWAPIRDTRDMDYPSWWRYSPGCSQGWDSASTPRPGTMTASSSPYSTWRTSVPWMSSNEK